MHLVGNVESLKQNGGIAFGGVAVFFADNAFEFTELHPVGVGHLGLFVDRVALLHGRPQAFVAHDYGVNRRVGVESELVLAQHTDLARTDDRPFLRVDFAAEQFHECGFSSAVGPGQAIALARRKRRGDFIEQYFGAVAHGHIADRKHGFFVTSSGTCGEFRQNGTQLELIEYHVEVRFSLGLRPQVVGYFEL